MADEIGSTRRCARCARCGGCGRTRSPTTCCARVLEAATWAPTGGNAQPWRVVVVRDAAKKQRLGELYAERWHAYSEHHRKLIADAPPSRRGRRRADARAPATTWPTTSPRLPAVLVFCFNPKQHGDHRRRGSAGSRWSAAASIYPAVQNALLACRAEGLGCVLTTLLCEVEPEVRALLAIPEPWDTAAAVPIGYPRAARARSALAPPVAKLAFGDRLGRRRSL